ncbi:MAG: hypothetical protein FRX49_13589 [Trebouxia sp. A1-2]|nr:MAG: hypothetical protein FRX49_13589 [Trebouxia sp. A1-2]
MPQRKRKSRAISKSLPGRQEIEYWGLTSGKAMAASQMAMIAPAQELLKEVAVLLVHIRARHGEQLAQHIYGIQPFGLHLNLQLMDQQRPHRQQRLRACQVDLPDKAAVAYGTVSRTDFLPSMALSLPLL